MLKMLKFLFGWIGVVWKFVFSLFDPEKNEEFYNKIDRDYFPGQ
jgi:hypothetical protein